jgi:AcrR family transcriptional regulator
MGHLTGSGGSVTLLHNTVTRYAVKVPRPRIHDETTRIELIEAAARLLAAEGPSALSTRRIAQQVGTSTTAIYSLLGSKEQVIRAVYLEGFQRLADRQNAMARTDDPVADLGALGMVYFENGLANPHLYDVMFHRTLPEFTPQDDDVAFALSTLQDVVDLAQRCIDSGIYTGDAASIATEVWALVHGVTSLAIAGMIDEVTARVRLAHLIEMSTAGYVSEASELSSPTRS